jgi:hypothetical protein
MVGAKNMHSSSGCAVRSRIFPANWLDAADSNWPVILLSECVGLRKYATSRERITIWNVFIDWNMAGIVKDVQVTAYFELT